MQRFGMYDKIGKYFYVVRRSKTS